MDEINIGNGINYPTNNVADINKTIFSKKKPPRPVGKPDEITRWRNTAMSDFFYAGWLYNLCTMYHHNLPPIPYYWVPPNPPYNWVYVIALDSVEKALKAVMIAWGIDFSHLPKQHDICGYINCLVSAQDKNDQFRKFELFRNEVEKAQYFYYRTRWPNWYGYCYHTGYTCIPSDHFSHLEALNILCLAQHIINIMNELLDSIYYV